MKKRLLFMFMILMNITANAQLYPSITNIAISNVTTTTAIISYTVSPNNCTAGAAIEVNYSTSSSLSPLSTINCPSTFTITNRTTEINGLTPGTQYFVRVKASTGSTCGNQTTNSAILNFTTISSITAPTIGNIVINSNGTTTTTINYSLIANGEATTSIIKYGTSASDLSNQSTGSTAAGYTATAGSAILNGLTPDETYFYQIEATNAIGTTSTAIYNFTNSPRQPIIAYNFDNTYNSIAGGNPFSSNAGTSFVTDRNGSPNGAINISNTGSRATIPNLPYGNSPRTVSVWVYLNVLHVMGYNHLYGYGQNALNQGNGGSVGTNSSGQPVAYHLGYGIANNHVASLGTLNNATWYHFVMTYDGTTSKIYRNAQLIGTEAKNWNTMNNNDFFNIGSFAGELYFNGALDDLKIYNFSINDADAANLFYLNSLASETFNTQNLKAVIYPNPASDHITIDTPTAIESVEIYSMQGQKIMTETSKEVNISKLSKGMYFVTVTDQNRNTATQKLIVK